jgi:hypothetical protein
VRKIYLQACRRCYETCHVGRHSKAHSWLGTLGIPVAHPGVQQREFDRVLDHKVRQRNSFISNYGW